MKVEKILTAIALMLFSVYELVWALYRLHVPSIGIGVGAGLIAGLWLLFPSPNRIFFPMHLKMIPDRIRFVVESALYLWTFFYTLHYQNFYLALLFGTLCAMSAFDNQRQIRALWEK